MSRLTAPAVALSDPDEQVRLAALNASTRVNVFRDIAEIVLRLDDPSSAVRTRALDALGALHADDAVVAIVAKLSPRSEPASSVRAAAAAALGEIGDASARGRAGGIGERHGPLRAGRRDDRAASPLSSEL